MRRWIVRHLSVVALLGLLVGLLAPAGASATTRAAAVKQIRSGSTTVTTAPGVAKALLGQGIAAFATSPGWQTTRSLTAATGPVVVASYPATSGNIGFGPVRGTINHAGGLLLANLKTGAGQVLVDNFIIDLKAKQLTARVPALGARIGIFALDLSKARVTLVKKVVTATGIGLRLLPTAAEALNASLGTTIFTAGLKFGTASTRLVTR